MVYEIIKCPYCQSEHIVRYGKSKTGKQKYKCCNEKCHKIFQLEYQYKACEPGIKEKVIAMVINGSGTRDTGRVLGIDKDTVTNILKKNVTIQSQKIVAKIHCIWYNSGSKRWWSRCRLQKSSLRL